MMNSTGSFHTAARFAASWKSPSLVAAVAAERRRHARLAAQLRRERQPVGHRKHRAEMTDHPDDVMLQRAEVERPIASLRESALFAEQLPEQHRQFDAARREDADVAVQRQDVVVGLERRTRRRRRWPPAPSPRTTWTACSAAAGAASSLRSGAAAAALRRARAARRPKNPWNPCSPRCGCPCLASAGCGGRGSRPRLPCSR